VTLIPDSATLFVTATPPTPNGDLHLGHFSGPYLAADVYARHQRRRGHRVALVTGIDDHQTYTHSRGLKEDLTAAEVADHFGDRIEQAWRDAGVRWDVVSRPRRSPFHRDLVDQFVRKLYADGHIVKRTRPLPWCPSCELWAFESYVAGACPHCETPACGNACEVCGQPNDCANLRDPKCTRCDTPCELRDCERLYFPLEPHRETLTRFWDEVSMNPHLRTLCAQMAEPGLPEIAVSHPGGWGLPVDVPGYTDHVVYVWFEMAAGYLATAAEWADGDWRQAWQDGATVQFFGYDNGYFHAVLFPAMMAAFDDRITLPKAFVSNEFYRLDGKKFSTSRRHAIWMNDGLTQAPADHLRLFLCYDRPVAQQTNFTWARMRRKLYEDTLPRWHQWLADTQRRFDLLTERRVEERWARTSPLRATVQTVLNGLDHAFSVEGFSPRRAFLLLDVLARDAAEYGAEHEYLAGAPGGDAALAEAAGEEVRALAAFAAGLAPLAPEMAEQLWSALGVPGAAADVRWGDLQMSQPSWTKVIDLTGRCALFRGEGA
jgi:methionyl-tRNA synthetase